MTLTRIDGITALSLTTWLSSIVFGFVYWARYDSTPGPMVSSSSPATHSSGCSGWELTLFVHPHCPCARATLMELSELALVANGQIKIQTLFVSPPGVVAGWERSRLWDAAVSIPGAEVLSDSDGIKARRAGAVTSGYAVLSDANGRVAFRGGITEGRGRIGESRGRRAILALITGGEATDPVAPTFGCPLFGPGSCPATGEQLPCRP